MARFALSFATLLAACGPTAVKTDPPANHAGDPTAVAQRGTFPALALADFVVLTDGRITAYALVGDAPQALGSLEIAGPIAAGAWFVDRDHFVLRAGDDVWLMTVTGASRLPTPPGEIFTAVPKPDHEVDPGHAVGISSSTGRVWWTYCPWGEAGPVWVCDVYAYSQLWPRTESWTVTTDVSIDEQPAHPPWPVITPAFPVTRHPDTYVPSCRREKATVAMPSPTGRTMGGDSHWFGAPSPAFLVEYGDPVPGHGYRTSEWALYDGCRAHPVATGTQYAHLDGELWTSIDADGHATLRRSLKALGPLPPYLDVIWRPHDPAP